MRLIQSEALSFSEIARQLVLRIRSGNPPDLAQIAGNDTLLLAATGGLESLKSFDSAGVLAKLKPTSLAGLDYKSQLIALPWNLAPAGLWFNREILAKAGLDPARPPKTIPELMTALAAIKSSQPDVIPLALDTSNRTYALSSNWPWMRTFGATPFGEGATGMTSPNMKAYLSWMRELSQKGYIEPGRRVSEYRPLISQQKVAFTWDQVLVQGVVQTTGKMSDEAFYKNFGVTTMPVGSANKPYSFEGGHQLVVFAKGKNKEAAWKFATFLATDPGAIATYTIGSNRSLPPIAHSDDANLTKLLDTPSVKVFVDEIIPTIAAQPYGTEFAAASTAIMAGIQETITGNRSIDEIATSVQREIDKK